MKAYRQCLYEKRLTARAQTMLDRIQRIDADHDSDLEKAKEYELATVQLMLDLLLSGPSLTVHGWKYIERQLAQRESWLAHLATTDE